MSIRFWRDLARAFRSETRHQRRDRKPRRLQLQVLERREVMSASPFVAGGGELESPVTQHAAPLSFGQQQAAESAADQQTETATGSELVAEPLIRVRRDGAKLTIRSLHEDQAVRVFPISNDRVRITARRLDGVSSLDRQIFSVEGVRTIVFLGTNGPDRFQNRSSIDTIAHGYQGDDDLRGGGGNDILNGGLGNDRLFGRGGDDDLRGQSGDDILVGGAGDDRLRGGSGADRLWGQHGNDTLSGGEGNDILHGGADHDTINGDRGADQLQGGSGSDLIYYEPDIDWRPFPRPDDRLIPQ